MLSKPSGIYIHVPFCRVKCPYCDFYSISRLDRINAYMDALLAELAIYRPLAGRVDSIYLGGGTPSLLSSEQVASIIEATADGFALANDVEITLEVNPGTVTRESLQAFRRIGVNRLNIGLQSLDDDALRMLGRIHTSRQGLRTCDWARSAGFDNLGLDLIYARPGQTNQVWRKEMGAVLSLEPEHLSCYTLTIEPGTPMAAYVSKGHLKPLKEGIAGKLFDTTIDFLEARGYRQYEISNFARHRANDPVDRRSRHNRKYWNLVPYLGFGPSAHTYRDGTRWWNYRSIEHYLSAVAAGASPIAGSERLTRDQQIMEFVFLGLRQVEGIDIDHFADRFNENFNSIFKAPLKKLSTEDLLKLSPGRVRLTRNGMRFMDTVVGTLLSG